MTAARVVSEIAATMALAPLAWLVGLRVRGQTRDVAWWWLALAFAVSWLADLAALWLSPWLVGIVYPLSQVGLVAAVFLPRREVVQLVGALVLVAVAAVFWSGAAGPDVLFRTVAWGVAAGIVVDRPALGRLRTALLVTFGLALVCWWGYAARPGWPTWLVYQGCRALGIALFCLAVTHPAPRFTLLRRTSP